MRDLLHIDFETYSACDLKKCGAYVYASHPSTGVWCMAYAFNDEPVELWRPGQPSPGRVLAHVRFGGKVMVHNFAFEHLIWNAVLGPQFGLPELSVEQGLCTMAMAYAMAIPGSLEKAAAAMGITEQKDMVGSRLMQQMCKPKSLDYDNDGGEIYGWWDDEEKIQRLGAYCKQDVEVERELGRRLMLLSPFESALWVLDQRINARGIRVDVPAIKRSIEIVEAEKERLNSDFQVATAGAVSTCTSVGQLKDWLAAQDIKVEGVAKNDVNGLLADSSLPPAVRRVLLLRQEAAKSSTAKLKSMAQRSSEDGRVRGTLQYHGAGTGRWAGRGIQIQNFPKGKFNGREVKQIFEILRDEYAPDYLSLLFGSPLTVISNVLRSFIIAREGYRLLWVDFKAIEARIIGWLAGQKSVLEIFRKGEDPYVHAAAGIYYCTVAEVTKQQRQVGKIAVLALGFGGGVGAYQVMAKGQNVKVTDAKAEIVKHKWRAANPEIVNFWYKLERIATAAVQDPGEVFFFGGIGNLPRISYKKSGSFLFCQLPSKRVICYPYPKIEKVETPWGEERNALTYMGEDSTSRQWKRQKAYGGLLAENVTQAVARDLLAEAMIRLETRGWNVVFHVHDEICCEMPTNAGSVEELANIASQLPEWAKGLPMGAEGDEGLRYRK